MGHTWPDVIIVWYDNSGCDNRERSVAFLVTNGVKQGYVLVPTLFSIIFSSILFDACNGPDNRIDIRYRTDGSVFNLKSLQAKTKVKTDIVREFVRRRLYIELYYQRHHTKQCGQVLNGLWQFWPNHQYNKDK